MFDIETNFTEYLYTAGHPRSTIKTLFNDIKSNVRPIALDITHTRRLNPANLLTAENFSGEKQKHFEMKQSNKHYWHNKHLYTCSGHEHHAQQELIQKLPFQNYINAIWAKLWSKQVHCHSGRKKNLQSKIRTSVSHHCSQRAGKVLKRA